jgi:nitroreductase
MNEIFQTIFRRRSIRKYTDRPVDDETLTLLLQAAMAAPTATNSQPWEFIVITEAETLYQLRGRMLFARYNAPAAIVVCGNPSIANSSSGQRYWEQDCCAAAENILIAATGLGLGSVWIGVHPLPGVIKTVREILEIPEQVIPLAMIYVGHPAEEKPARTQYDVHRVHWQKYEPRKRKLKIKNAKYL